MSDMVCVCVCDGDAADADCEDAMSRLMRERCELQAQQARVVKEMKCQLLSDILVCITITSINSSIISIISSSFASRSALHSPAASRSTCCTHRRMAWRHCSQATCMGIVISVVCHCVSLCPYSKRKTAWTISTKLGRHKIECMALAQHALTWGQKVKGHGHVVIKCADGVGMHFNRTVQVFKFWDSWRSITIAKCCRGTE